MVLASGTGGVAYLPSDLGAKFINGSANALKGIDFIYGSQGATRLDLVPLSAWEMLGLTVEPGWHQRPRRWPPYVRTRRSQHRLPDIVIVPERRYISGCGLVPTLIFGIPGSGSMAIFIGGVGLLGFDVGPQLITNNLDATYTRSSGHLRWPTLLAPAFAFCCRAASPN